MFLKFKQFENVVVLFNINISLSTWLLKSSEGYPQPGRHPNGHAGRIHRLVNANAVSALLRSALKQHCFNVCFSVSISQDKKLLLCHLFK